jgi:hypothetical protein
MPSDHRTRLAGRFATPHRSEAGAEYLRKLEESLRYWYSAAETKAQVVLTLNGVFLAFLTGSVLTSGDKAAKTVTVFGPETWAFVAGLAAGIAGAIFCAIRCLVARGCRSKDINKTFAQYEVDPEQGDTYIPEVSVFFAYLAQLRPEHFVKQMRAIGPQFVVQALATDNILWSKSILAKHRWVNLAFSLTGIALGFFLCVGVSYLIRVSLGT